MTSSGLQERHHDYVLGPNQDSRLASVAAGATLTDLELQLDTDAPFSLRSRCARQKFTTGGNFPTQNGLQYLKTRWSGPLKDYRQQQFISEACSGAYFGQCGIWKPEYPETHYPAGGVLTVDIYNAGSEPITNLYLIFRGVKLFPWGSVPAYEYPQKFAGIGNFNYQIQVLNLGVSEFRDNQIFTVKQDADFVLRGGQATPSLTRTISFRWTCCSGPVASLLPSRSVQRLFTWGLSVAGRALPGCFILKSTCRRITN
jgi:hypothetical protein